MKYKLRKTILLTAMISTTGIVLVVSGLSFIARKEMSDFDESLSWIFLVLGIMVILLLMVLMGMLKFRSDDRNLSKYLKEQEEYIKVRDLLLENAKARMWQIKDGMITIAPGLSHDRHIKRSRYTLETFKTLIHPDSYATYNELCDFRSSLGYKRLRIRLSYDGGLQWKWYEFIFTVTKQNVKRHAMAGMMLNIMNIVDNEKKLIEAERRASEVKAKENFIANIGNDMNIPFEAIIGFSQIMAFDTGSLTTEEKQQFAKVIHDNTEQLLSIINKVAHDSLKK